MLFYFSHIADLQRARFLRSAERACVRPAWACVVSVTSCIVNKCLTCVRFSYSFENMGRAWRIEYEGGLYHVLSRGNERKDIFYDDQDRLTFLGVIGEMAEHYDVDIFSYVLMNNHYHILLRTNQSNLSKSMQWLALTYTRRFNNRHG